MPIHLVCECGARVIAPIKRAGQSIRCPKCDGRIPVPLGEGQSQSAFSSPMRPSRIESAISDLVTARHADTGAPRRSDRIDPPQEKLRPTAPVPAQSPALVPAMAPAPSTRLEPGPRIEAVPKVEAAPAVRTRPAAPIVTVPLDEAPEIKITAALCPISKPIRIVTAGRGAQVDKGWLGAAYGVALLCAGLAVVGIAIACAESWAYYRAEELWRMQRWALLVLTASAVQLALAIYLAQVADWIACRAAAAVISCIAAAEAMILAVALFSNREGWFARFLDLAPHMRDNRAIGVTLLLTLLSVLLAYTAASVSIAWERFEARGVLRRAPSSGLGA